jgi:hypothetical protein
VWCRRHFVRCSSEPPVLFPRSRLTARSLTFRRQDQRVRRRGRKVRVWDAPGARVERQRGAQNAGPFGGIIMKQQAPADAGAPGWRAVSANRLPDAGWRARMDGVPRSLGQAHWNIQRDLARLKQAAAPYVRTPPIARAPDGYRPPYIEVAPPFDHEHTLDTYLGRGRARRHLLHALRHGVVTMTLHHNLPSASQRTVKTVSTGGSGCAVAGAVTGGSGGRRPPVLFFCVSVFIVTHTDLLRVTTLFSSRCRFARRCFSVLTRS